MTLVKIGEAILNLDKADFINIDARKMGRDGSYTVPGVRIFWNGRAGTEATFIHDEEGGNELREFLANESVDLTPTTSET